MKKCLSSILCAVISLCLAACNDTSHSAPEGASSTPTTEQDTFPSPVFNTENVARITFYAYYGTGTGSDVPSENMEEITNWLGAVTAERKVTDEVLAPGTNTYYVEIEYADGRTVKNGLDVISVDGVRYLLKKTTPPDCFAEIISKASL